MRKIKRMLPSIIFFFLMLAPLLVTGSGQSIKKVDLQRKVMLRSMGDGGQPIVFVEKTADKEEVNLGEDINISIVIGNYGNVSALNVTVIDENYSAWVIKTENFVKIHHIPRLYPNTTMIITYKIRILNSAQENFSLGIVRVEYYDAKGNKYISTSKELTIKIKAVAIEINLDKIRKNMILASTILIVPIIATLIIIERKVLLEYEQKRKKQ